MSDKKVNSVEKQGKFKALKNEFNKIMWPPFMFSFLYNWA